MKITLPEKPVDLYEIKWWYVYGPERRVYEGRLVYHVNRTWGEVFPHDRSHLPPGAPFQDEWQVFQNGEFVGRIGGWDLVNREKSFEMYQDGYATREEAVARARQDLQVRIARLKEEIAEYERRLAKEDLR